MMSFTDQKPRVVTKKHYSGHWSGRTDDSRFRCYMCGHHFKIGDVFRWVMGDRICNLNMMVCDRCDGPDIRKRWAMRVKEYYYNKDKFWWAMRVREYHHNKDKFWWADPE